MRPLLLGLALAFTVIGITYSSQADALFHSWRNIAYFNSDNQVIGYRVYTCSSTNYARGETFNYAYSVAENFGECPFGMNWGETFNYCTGLSDHIHTQHLCILSRTQNYMINGF